MKLDIKVSGNMMGGRQGFAYICNSGEFEVIPIEIDDVIKEGSTYHRFGKVRVPSRRGFTTGKLEVSEGKWRIGGSGTCIKDSFSFHDMEELLDNANAPVLEPNKPFVIAWIFRDMGNVALNMFKYTDLNVHCQVMADIQPLSDEEMETIKSDAKRWCNR